MSIWDKIHAERALLADRLDALDPSDWGKQSLADEWTIRDAVAHMISSTYVSPGSFFVSFAKSGFNFPKMFKASNKALTSKHSDVELAALFRERMNTTTAPPAPKPSVLGEVIVHGEDVTRALGSYGEHNTDNVILVADYYKKSNVLIGAKNRVEGVQLVATDAKWKHGNGPTVEGPAIALLMAMTGRKVALDDLSGEGVEVLRSRD